MGECYENFFTTHVTYRATRGTETDARPLERKKRKYVVLAL